ncbi:MAG TPA: flagellar motor protein MotB [Candidatus Eisenbacteria bacterium]|nr:flagellar motor protein MotB [Candidatus Eisenbacteria bacterium]
MNGTLRTGVSLALVLGLAGCVSSSKFNRLQAERSLLENEKSSLQQRAEELAQDNTQLKGEIVQLEAQKRTLADERDALKKTHEETVTQYDAVVNKLSQEVNKGNLQIRQYKNMLTVDVAEKIFFDTGSATIKPGGQEVLKKVGDAMAAYQDKVIRVVGHTDNVPLKGRITNWELSAMRATHVVRFLQDECKIDPQRLVATGRSEYQPVAANDTPEGRQKNRRIEITLMDKNLADSMGEAAASTK